MSTCEGISGISTYPSPLMIAYAPFLMGKMIPGIPMGDLRVYLAYKVLGLLALWLTENVSWHV